MIGILLFIDKMKQRILVQQSRVYVPNVTASVYDLIPFSMRTIPFSMRTKRLDGEQKSLF